MPLHKYVKPKNKVADVYRGKEMKELVQSALQKTFGLDGKKGTKKKVDGFLGSLIGPWLGGEVVVTIEHFPLNSKSASGKFGNEIHAVIKKTGTVRVKAYKKPRNPKTPSQQKHRGKYRVAVDKWNALPEPEKEKYRQRAEKLHMTDYNLFMQENLTRKKDNTGG